MTKTEEAAADKFERSLSELAARYLRITSVVVTVFYLFRIVNYLAVFEPPKAYLLALPMAFSVLCCAAVVAHTWYKQLSPKVIAFETFFIAFLLTGNVYWNLYLTENPLQLFSVCLVVVALGMVTVYRWIWLLQVGFCIGAYVFAVAAYGGEWSAQFASMMVAGLSLSFIAFQSRAPVIAERLTLEIQLQADADKLRKANVAKDRFVANMTHELRTPLTGVMGMMDLLEDTPMSKEQSFMLTNAQKSAQYLLNIVNDILDFSKLEAGKLELKKRPVDLISVCRDAASVFEAPAKEKGLALALMLPASRSLVVEADGLRIGQVLMNYIGNAIKFTESGSITLKLEWQDANDGTGLAVFTVTDTGVGIPPEKTKVLFSRFEQVDDSITRGASGTGLGLAICKELARLMGGQVGVDSQQNEGSSFRFAVELPTAKETEVASAPVTRVIAPAVDMSPSKEVATAEESGPANRTGKRVLLAEDNPINQIIISRMLAQEDLDVEIVENGEEAVAAATKEGASFDIIFLDVQMPTMDGVSANKLIRQKLKDPPPIVAITANTHRADISKYLGAGMDAVLGKPLDRAKLKSIIQKYTHT